MTQEEKLKRLMSLIDQKQLETAQDKHVETEKQIKPLPQDTDDERPEGLKGLSPGIIALLELDGLLTPEEQTWLNRRSLPGRMPSMKALLQTNKK